MGLLVDARDLPDGQVVRADVCVVGAGAAGITVARALRDTGLSVALVEGGGRVLDEQTQALYAGSVAGEPYYDLDATRLRLFGGSTNHWEGWCLPLDPMDFERRAWVPWSGWPLTVDDLEPYYEAAHELCQLGPYEYDDAPWASALGVAPLPVDPAWLRGRVLQRSPPTRFGDRYEADLLESPAIDVYMHANVVNVERDRPGTRVARLLVRHFDGRSAFVQAERFVLALGGLENPRLLLASADGHGDGIGNEHDLVGRFFMEHSHLALGHVTTDDTGPMEFYSRTHDARGGSVRASFGLPEELQRRESLLNAHVLFWELGPIGHQLVQASPLVAGVESLLQDVHDQRWEDLTRVTVIAEQAPNPSSRVRLGRDRDALGMPRISLDWQLRPRDREVVRRCAELAAGQLGVLGVGRLHSLVHGPEPLWPRITGGHHHLGTTRMHPDPRQGVVDADCRVHGLDNLYVAGSSVFPTGGMANPTLTVVALALRLADHLREEA